MDLRAIKRSRMFMRAIKIGVGSAAAIMIAEFLHLEYASSAGIVALLTITTTKWETVRLAWSRVVSFGVSVCMAFILFQVFGTNWVTYGLFMFCISAVSFLTGWESAISVNAVTGSQILMTGDFSIHFILNEFLIVVIGISVAIVLNLISDYQRQQQVIINDMRYTENEMRRTMGEIARYMLNDEQKTEVWNELIALEGYLALATDRAWNYQNDTFVSHPEYYINYFEMRSKQTNTLHTLHYQVKILKNHPDHAAIAADILVYIQGNIREMNDPDEQIASVKAAYRLLMAQPIPESREDFEGQAVLYHILMDTEEFLVYEKRFVSSLDDIHMKIYRSQGEQSGFIDTAK